MSSSPKAITRDALMELVPANYSPRLHMLLPTLTTALICAVALWRIDQLRLVELLTIPAMLVISNLCEWLAHRYMLHQRLPLVGTIYERHELHHHSAFTHESMPIDHPRQLWMVLIPAYAVLVLLATTAPIALLAGWLLSVNVGWLVVSSALVYFIVYEWLHLAYHLPSSNPVSRWPLICKLRKLHQTHHNPALMKRYNFNVTVGLFDRLLGTLWSEGAAERAARDDHHHGGLAARSNGAEMGATEVGARQPS